MLETLAADVVACVDRLNRGRPAAAITNLLST
jgi:hypothetical protein